MKRIAIMIIGGLLIAVLAIAFAGGKTAPAAALGPVKLTTPSASARFLASIQAHFSTGKGELQRAFGVKQQARSYRMKTITQLRRGEPMETIVEVVCPDRERFITTASGKEFHAVRIGSTGYLEREDGTWNVVTTPPSGWAPCGPDPGEPAPWAVVNEGRDPTAVLAKLEGADISRGVLVSTPAGECQQWIIKLQMPGAVAHAHGSKGLEYTLCVDPKQHLPMAVAMGGTIVTSYYDWNKPIQIDPPKM
ncbi:MAG TPA: hypothetical protein VE783_08510 [Candidatus Limnocylindrales bacterium]|nr:hypothetical protein [Candidatus Limnocylindrales bacterium]